MTKKTPTVELTLPILPDMELAATKTGEVVAKHMGLNEEQTAEISMAIIEACINAFEHSDSKNQIEIHFIINQDNLVNISRTKIGISKEYQLGISNFREPSNIIPKNFDIINYSSDSIVLRQKNPELFMYLIEVSINRKNGEIIWHKRSFKDINQHWIKGKCKNNKNMF